LICQGKLHFLDYAKIGRHIKAFANISKMNRGASCRYLYYPDDFHPRLFSPELFLQGLRFFLVWISKMWGPLKG
jgi:hypothetical protein